MNAASKSSHLTGWFCLRSQSRHEHVAVNHLKTMEGIEVYCPKIRYRKLTRSGAVWVTEPLFPSYLFARFDSSQWMPRVRSAHGVIGVVSFGGRYASVSPSVIDDLRSHLGDNEVSILEPTLQVGDAVRMTDGAFRGLRAVVTQIFPAKERVRVLLEFLGRNTEVEVPAVSVISESKNPLAVM